MIDIDHLAQWVGRTETQRDLLDPVQAGKLALTLDRAEAPQAGDPLPPLWHWAYFAPRAPRSGIGEDGHPKRGGFLPPVPLPRRMWAGGRLKFLAPLSLGETVTRESEILSVSAKQGKQGALVFLTLRHRIGGAAGLAIEEEQDIVYRDHGSTAQPAPFAGDLPPADWRDAVVPDPVLLFRYSAVTFNGHRIHYDLPYATGVEGYPGLVVHGPLTATLLADAALRHTGGRIAEFTFRGQAPLFAGQDMRVCGRREGADCTLWAEGQGGYAGMSAIARMEG